MAIDKSRATVQLKAFDFSKLFIEELGWDRPTSRQPEIVGADGQSFNLKPVADKRGVRIFHCEVVPDRNVRQRIEREIAKRTFEHLIIFTDAARSRQIWQWVAREKGKPDAFREHAWLVTSAPDALIQKLDHIAFALDEEESLTLAGTTLRMRDAFDRERITKRFYEAFKEQHDSFLGFIEGLASATDRQWYASLMLNRLMFVYFIQKKAFLDSDINYLKNRLTSVRATKGTDQFHSFYRAFLLKLFHGGLAIPKDARDEDTARLLGNIPYLNGGLFEPHALEADGNAIAIADAAFEGVFNFFDQYEWTLDTRAIERADGREINPDVLGHIFEKYINQKQMGAYYTKEDITDYITKNTVLPWLFQNAVAHDRVAFEAGGALWRMLSENPDTYIYKEVKHGAELPLPENIAAGIADVAQRGDWNKAASAEHGLPTEIWREVVARRERYESTKAKAAEGEISSIEDLITLNLDIRQFARDAIQYAESPDLVRAFWKGISAIKVLDPACGSGAFLFAALNILYDLYDACLERMEQFVESAATDSGPRQLYSDFRTVLDQIDRHPNRAYFIYKSIILDNLYGVDIMDEAVEICKLRLFLKLASQLERADQIEPLPDIDFNIRAGNSLIGYASMADVRRATAASGFDFDDRAGKIEAAAQDLDAAFRLFREQQTALHGVIGVDHKANLRTRLAALEKQLDHFLATDYGVDNGNHLAAAASFEKWKANHKPFHWLIEFYGIIRAGGFDVLVGNPPYIEVSKVKSYRLLQSSYGTLSCGNLYAPFVERAYELTRSAGWISLIVPLSLVSTARTNDLRSYISKFTAWISSYDMRPGSLFEGVAQRLSILISQKVPNERGTIFVGDYRRWKSAARPALIPNTAYTEVTPTSSGAVISKFSNPLESEIRMKIEGPSLENFKGGTENPFVVHRIVRYFVKALSFTPKFVGPTGTSGKSDDYKEFKFLKDQQQPIIALLNSSLFYWFWRTTSDGFHCGYADVYSMPYIAIQDSNKVKRIISLNAELMAELANTSVEKSITTKAGKIIYQEFSMGRAKHILDKIDAALADHYGFSDVELDFIVNYDIKFRMGADDGDAD
ncbi:site-specific DNA-methyltransferase (adenine-specific) [Rhizobium leguminosarum]|uniref:Eco57I restriction-modification methylase domain-containing protein n=1 Tax=Rhizobium leguminosarum TaxID=384 RepID=UPI001C97775E|nr:DNA methyltransferase [Rhizobium leguminosarum]MBY5672286.1 site-specific DNA-methyltransferase (adenine-specific) [Rhizobium leguminosarum]MBY5685004.1 site-specific DNA-methyltransferase (adenine-specific) [Rhizobium leguminosarum]